MKRIDRLTEELTIELDTEYSMLRELLTSGYAPEPFNTKGQRTQSTFLADFKVKVEAIQELNRLKNKLKRKRVVA